MKDLAVKVDQKAEIMNGVVGYQHIRVSDSKKAWYEKVWGKIFIGIVIGISTTAIGLLLKRFVG